MWLVTSLMKIDLSGPYTGLSDEDKSRIVNCREPESLREEGPLQKTMKKLGRSWELKEIRLLKPFHHKKPLFVWKVF